MNEDAIYIVLDETDPTNPVFIEIENEKGESISIGERVDHEFGELVSIKITPEMIERLGEDE